MATQSTQVPPLRVHKGSISNQSSPTKAMPFAQSRPLSELSPMALRRNSPSFPRNSLSKHDSSPTSSSPFNNTASPKMFWHTRDPNSPSSENRSPFDNISPSKRSSIENLKKASRVKNSSMFAKEQQNNYDPSSPRILDGRPLRNSLQGNAFSGRPSFTGSSTTSPPKLEVKTNATTVVAEVELEVEEDDSVVHHEPPSSPFNPVTALSPSKSQVSPTKSSLSKKTGANARKSGFDPATGIWEDDDEEERRLPEGRRLHRHAKSVTFDQAPPQINEYEMTTPDPSSVASGSREGSYESFDDEDDEEEYSFERGSSFDPHDDSFDASLEDTEKTPVVLPEDWRFMNPETAANDLVRGQDDVFDDKIGSPAPEARPGTHVARPQQASAQSVDSNGYARPLPPLPPTTFGNESDVHRDSLSGTLERMSGSSRALPSPPIAGEKRRTSNTTFSLEDRLKMLAIAESPSQKAEVEAQRERRMRRATSKDTSPTREQSQAAQKDNVEDNIDVAASDRHTDRRLSRDFIMQQLRIGSDDISRSNSQYSSASLDPDVPIPSREDPTQNFEDDVEDEVIIKDEPLDDDELYKIPEMCRKTSSQLDAEDEEFSQYSETSIQHSVDLNNDTPRAQSPAAVPRNESSSTRMSLPDFMDFGAERDLDFGLREYMTSDPAKVTQPSLEQGAMLPDLATLRSEISRPFTPEQSLDRPNPHFMQRTSSEPGTPSSVIHHPVEHSETPEASQLDGNTDEPAPGPSILTGSKGVDSTHSPAGSIQSLHSSLQPTPEVEEQAASTISLDHPTGGPVKKRISSLVQLDIPCVEVQDGLGLGLEAEFDRVVETQKRGYLMRQNTKVVVATERVSIDEPASPTLLDNSEDVAHPAAANEVVASPRKASQPTWVAEPWNNKSRRRSIRVNGVDSPKKKVTDSFVPPLPGHPSSVTQDLGAVVEDEFAEQEAEDFEDGAERGRLFVKVVGVKDLQLPFPTQEQTMFALTLDNGLHCVTTSWLNLAREAPIGQEFELVVLNDLEFQLTLQMKLEEPRKPAPRPASPTKAPSSPKKQNAFGRLFGSPKKRKDSDVRVPEPGTVRRPVTPPSAYELVQGIVAKDGSFARAYVSLSEFEKQAYGRPATVDIKCFNEWAMEEVSVGSSRSKKGVVQLQRRPPYEIGKLELQLLYVPKPKGAKDEDMPKSMNGAIRAMREAEERMKQQSVIKEFEGYLSQQGGDCPYWRRRFFKLVGPKLTAYHETTRQPRATINLTKAAKLIDDKANLAQKEVSTRKGGRRKSAFAEDEEGYMFVEEGFRVRFANGEVIDFYAENAALKDEWMAALSQVVGKTGVHSGTTSAKSWTDAVLKKEKSSKSTGRPAIPLRKESKEKDLPARPAATNPPQSFAPTKTEPSPQKPPANTTRPQGHTRTESYLSELGLPRSQADSPVKMKVHREERHRKTKSMWG